MTVTPTNSQDVTIAFALQKGQCHRVSYPLSLRFHRSTIPGELTDDSGMFLHTFYAIGVELLDDLAAPPEKWDAALRMTISVVDACAIALLPNVVPTPSPAPRIMVNSKHPRCPLDNFFRVFSFDLHFMQSFIMV